MTQKTGKRYSEAQIIRVLEQVDKGQKVEDIWNIRTNFPSLEKTLWRPFSNRAY
jgi:hypothetical protein